MYRKNSGFDHATKTGMKTEAVLHALKVADKALTGADQIGRARAAIKVAIAAIEQPVSVENTAKTTEPIWDSRNQDWD